jgi:hypothetical protein
MKKACFVLIFAVALFGVACTQTKSKSPTQPTMSVADVTLKDGRSSKPEREVVTPETQAQWYTRSLVLGGYRNANQLIEDLLINHDFAMTEIVVDMIHQIRPSPTKKTVQITIVAAAQLGFMPDDGPTLEQIYARAKKYGLEPLPAEAGPEFRLQYSDQGRRTGVIVATAPIAAKNEYMTEKELELFFVCRHDSIGIIPEQPVPLMLEGVNVARVKGDAGFFGWQARYAFQKMK